MGNTILLIFFCAGNSFSPVPFMGRLRARRFHSLTYLWYERSQTFCCANAWVSHHFRRKKHENLAKHVATLPAHRWVQHWRPWHLFWWWTHGPSTTYVGVKTSCVLHVCESSIVEKCGFGRHPVELTFGFVSAHA